MSNRENDFEDLGHGSRRKTNKIERETFFSDLYTQDDYCPNCEYEGRLKPTKRGWRCPKCKTVILTNNEDD